MKKKVIDGIINRLLQVRDRTEKNFPLSECETRQLCEASRKIFLEQPILLEVEPPINICGDTHGQYSDLLRIFDLGGYPPHTDYLFLGDYVDRGDQGLETICLLLAYKIKYPRKFFLLRGNHETVDMNKKYGFCEQCEEKFNEGLWKTFIECFNCLPLAAIVGEKIFCVHGGISRHLHDLDEIRKITRPTESEIPYEGLLCDLLWSDPCNKIYGWGKNTTRNCSCFFGPDKVTEFLQKHDLDLICRGHQDVDGYEFFAGQQLVTIFSAPNYNGRKNSGAMMSVDENLKCSFQLIEPSYEKPTTEVKGKSSLDKEIDGLKLEIGEVTTKLKELTTKLEQLERKRGRGISPARYYD